MQEDFNKSVLGITCIENLCHWSHRLHWMDTLESWVPHGEVLVISDEPSDNDDTVTLSPHPRGQPGVQYQYPTGDDELDQITVEVIALELWELMDKCHYKTIKYLGGKKLPLDCIAYLKKLHLL